MGGRGLDFQTWETSKSGIGENNYLPTELQSLPHLSSVMGATGQFSAINHRFITEEICLWK
jgi:hypothetical protein